jgi:hypothetical protein
MGWSLEERDSGQRPVCQVGGLRCWTGARSLSWPNGDSQHGITMVCDSKSWLKWLQQDMYRKKQTMYKNSIHLHVIENLYIYTWTPTVVAHWILTMSHHVTVPLEVGPSAGHYSFGHPAGTVGYCAPEVAQPVRVLPQFQRQQQSMFIRFYLQ